MKKLFSVTLTAVMISALFCGCFGNTRPSGTATPTPDASAGPSATVTPGGTSTPDAAPETASPTPGGLLGELGDDLDDMGEDIKDGLMGTDDAGKDANGKAGSPGKR